MKPDLWAAVANLRKSDQDSELELVDLTLTEATQRLEGDRGKLLTVYSKIGQYQGILRKGDDFWAWFEQLRQNSSAPDGSPEFGPSELRETLAASLKKNRATVVGATLRRWTQKLLTGNFLPAFALTFVLVLLALRAENIYGLSIFDFNVLVSAFFYSSAVALALGLALLPLTNSIRKSTERSPKFLSGLLTGLIITVALPFVIGGLSMAATSFGVDYFEPQSYLRPRTWYRIPSEYMTFCAESRFIGWLSVLIAVGSAFGVTLFSSFIARKQYWVPVSRASRGWYLLSLPCLVATLIYAGHFTSVVWDGSHYDEDLQATLKAQKARNLDRSPQRTFDSHPLVKEHLQKDNSAQIRSKIVRIWLDAGQELWNQENWWTTPGIENYMAQSRYALGWHFGKVPLTYPETEICLRQQLCYQMTQSPSSSFPQNLLALELSEAETNRLLTILLQRPLDPRTPEHILELLRESLIGERFNFREGWKTPEEPSSDGKWQAIIGVHTLNESWRFAKSKNFEIRSCREPSDSNVKFLGHQPSEVFEDPFMLEPGYAECLPDFIERLAHYERERSHKTALIATVLELKLKKLKGEKLPESVSELSPKLQKFLAPHKDCLTFESKDSSVSLGIILGDPEDVIVIPR